MGELSCGSDPATCWLGCFSVHLLYKPVEPGFRDHTRVAALCLIQAKQLPLMLSQCPIWKVVLKGSLTVSVSMFPKGLMCSYTGGEWLVDTYS